jgi:hypothetical protein
LAEMDKNRTRSSAGWPELTDSSSTRRLKCSHESSRLMNRSGLWAIVGPAPISISFSLFAIACADSMKFQSIPSADAGTGSNGRATRVCYRDDLSMTLTFATPASSRWEQPAVFTCGATTRPRARGSPAGQDARLPYPKAQQPAAQPRRTARSGLPDSRRHSHRPPSGDPRRT